MAHKNSNISHFQRFFSYPLQGLFAHMFYWLFAALPIDTASAIGARIGRWIGPKLSVTRRARRNLERAFPEKTPEELQIIIGDMWDNLGRSIGEVPHIHKIEPGSDRLEVVGLANGLALKDDGKPGQFFTAHIGNWEVTTLVARIVGMEMMSVYRAPDNPWVDSIFNRARQGFRGEQVPKGPAGARKLTAFLKNGGHAAMLVDQKMNNGIAVPFFGRDAMTAPALAQFCLRYDTPLVPVRVERLQGAHFRMTFYPQMDIVETDDRHKDILTIMTDVNAIMEGWIRERPAQWLWLHRRWPD
ncbi:lauroyl acyltransferase [Thalassospira mesophila]|uniref:Lauroyl acyltransferase n=1 Tax=Thalassospira mesophila TaxID=1293891 RepID=A0A1Y2L308_9PROT|nr:lauroyl acyltransferase [Thalassospira mesophila]OSQ39594.1 lauroyl acyltransferase [Thalassospira mesophila]